MEITASDLNRWKEALNELEQEDPKLINEQTLKHVADILEHSPPQVAPRLHKDFLSCINRSSKILCDLFDKIDISDKQLLNTLLNLFIAYGNCRIAQITYHIETPRDRIDPDFNFTPIFVKTKWYDLSPLLPAAGTIGWKNIIVHGLVIEERQLFQTCLRLLTQKLHFHAISLMICRFENSIDTIQKNGERVAEKLAEKILDFANDDHEMIGIDTYLFNLLVPFTSDEQQAAIVEATVQDRFKSNFITEPEFKFSNAVVRIRSLICECIMDKAHLQDVLISKLLEHLKCNLIRRKRRHSIEASNENQRVTLEDLIAGVLNGTELTKLIDDSEDVKISAKNLQTTYLTEWVDFLNDILPGKILTFRNANMLVATCSILFVTTSNIISEDLIVKLLSLMTKTLDYTGQRRFEKHFRTFGNNFLLKFSKSVASRPELLGVLIFIMKIAIYLKDQNILDEFVDLIPRLYDQMFQRVEELIEKVKIGVHLQTISIDQHLPRLTSLYVEHKTMIEPYVSGDLLQQICDCLLFQKDQEDRTNGSSIKDKKKAAYNDLKGKLETLQGNAKRSQSVYQNIINKQYNMVVDQTISQTNEIRNEDSCCRKYLDHMKIISKISVTLFQHCDFNMYKLVLENIVSELEDCDALDHPKVLYLFLILESIILKQQTKDLTFAKLFEEMLPQISSSLLRISKSVEFGPSIHLFTRPGAHKSGGGIQCCTYSNCIRVYALIFSRYPAKITNPFLTEALQICVSSNLARYAKNSTRLHKFFTQLATSISSLLKAICMGRKQDEILRLSMPLYLSILSLLIRSLILASDRQKLQEQLPQMNGNGTGGDDLNHSDVGSDGESSSTISRDIYESHLESLARDIGRILNNLSYLETKLVDYAPHLISTYIKDTQKGSCPDYVRKHLDEGVYRIFNLIDAYQKSRQQEVIKAGIQRKTTAGKASGSMFKMIQARLDQASREIFQNMHDEYNKFHRYLGKC